MYNKKLDGFSVSNFSIFLHLDEVPVDRCQVFFKKMCFCSSFLKDQK